MSPVSELVASEQVDCGISVLESGSLQIFAKMDEVKMILQLFSAEMLLTDSEGAVSYGHFWSLLLGNHSLSRLFGSVLAFCMQLQPQTLAFGIRRILLMRREVVKFGLGPSEIYHLIDVFPNLLFHSPCCKYYKHTEPSYSKGCLVCLANSDLPLI